MKKTRSHDRRTVGRPSKDHLDSTIQIRVSKADQARFEKCAQGNNLNLSQWMRLVCARAAGATAANVKMVSVEFDIHWPETPGGEPAVPIVPLATTSS
jgi:hypothetical protein